MMEESCAWQAAQIGKKSTSGLCVARADMGPVCFQETANIDARTCLFQSMDQSIHDAHTHTYFWRAVHRRFCTENYKFPRVKRCYDLLDIT